MCVCVRERLSEAYKSFGQSVCELATAARLKQIELPSRPCSFIDSFCVLQALSKSSKTRESVEVGNQRLEKLFDVRDPLSKVVMPSEPWLHSAARTLKLMRLSTWACTVGSATNFKQRASAAQDVSAAVKAARNKRTNQLMSSLSPDACMRFGGQGKGWHGPSTFKKISEPIADPWVWGKEIQKSLRRWCQKWNILIYRMNKRYEKHMIRKICHRVCKTDLRFMGLPGIYGNSLNKDECNMSQR